MFMIRREVKVKGVSIETLKVEIRLESMGVFFP